MVIDWLGISSVILQQTAVPLPSSFGYFSERFALRDFSVAFALPRHREAAWFLLFLPDCLFDSGHEGRGHARAREPGFR